MTIPANTSVYTLGANGDLDGDGDWSATQIIAYVDADQNIVRTNVLYVPPGLMLWGVTSESE